MSYRHLTHGAYSLSQTTQANPFPFQGNGFPFVSKGIPTTSNLSFQLSKRHGFPLSCFQSSHLASLSTRKINDNLPANHGRRDDIRHAVNPCLVNNKTIANFPIPYSLNGQIEHSRNTRYFANHSNHLCAYSPRPLVFDHLSVNKGIAMALTD